MRRIPLLMFLLIAVNGCAGNDLIVQRQSSMEGRLEQIMQAHNSAKAEYASVAVQLQTLKELSARQAAAEKEQVAKYEDLQLRVKILTSRLAQLEATARQSATIELVNQEGIGAGHEESVQAAYMKAFGLFSANNYSAAAEAFDSFIAVYPESEYAANARYWLGECYFTQGHYKKALDSYTRVLETNPAPKREAEVRLRIGMSWYRLDMPEKGAEALRQLIKKYPGSEAAVKAEQQLAAK